MTPSDLQKLRALAEAASREWSADVWIETDGNEWRATGPGHEDHASDDGAEPGCPDEQAAQRDAAFIRACSPTTLLSLLDQLAAAQAEAARSSMHARVSVNAAEAMTGAFERCKDQLAAVTAARDEACTQLATVRAERNAMRQAAPVMLTVLALIADEADEAGLREAALHYTERADHDHLALWLDECHAHDASLRKAGGGR